MFVVILIILVVVTEAIFCFFSILLLLILSGKFLNKFSTWFILNTSAFVSSKQLANEINANDALVALCMRVPPNLHENKKCEKNPSL